MKPLPKPVSAESEMPTQLGTLCSRLRQQPWLLKEWVKDCPPEALLAAVLQAPVLWGVVPAQHARLVQAGAQLLETVRSHGTVASVDEQSALGVWLDEAGTECRESRLQSLRAFVVQEAIFEVHSQLTACKNLLAGFVAELPPELSHELLAATAKLADSASEVIPLRPESNEVAQTQPDLGLAGVLSWLQAKMQSTYLEGDERRSSALRMAILALKNVT